MTPDRRRIHRASSPRAGAMDLLVDRRGFLAGAGLLAGGLLGRAQEIAEAPSVAIRDVRIGKGVEIEAENGVIGSFAGSPHQNLPALDGQRAKLREALVGKNAMDLRLGGETLWEALYPGKARLFGGGRDPISGELILNKPRAGRHTPTGCIFVAFSTVDVALWDLRARLCRKPAYRIMGPQPRGRVAVYWRPGEVGIAPAEAARKARDAFDRGYRTQKWYFNKGARDGGQGFKENVELVRVLREALPEAELMFDNHSIRHSDDVDYSLRLCKAVAPYKPYWIEEPVCPEHLEGYARIKGETGLPIAGGEHWYTRWAVQPFLERRCVDFVQSDPTWCGGISEWLAICAMVRAYRGIRVVPHITSPWIVAPHCVASQPEELCPLLEFNAEGGRATLEKHMRPQPDGRMFMALPPAEGVS